MSMKEFPIIETKRILLCKLHSSHIPEMVKYANNRKISDHIVNMPYPYTEINASIKLGMVSKGFETGKLYSFALVEIGTRNFVGEVTLNVTDVDKRIAELGYWIAEPFWNNGYATEAVEAIVRYGLENVGLNTIYATCKPRNIPSHNVLLKNNFEKHYETPSQLTFITETNSNNLGDAI